jgi:hypothetical protein
MKVALSGDGGRAARAGCCVVLGVGDVGCVDVGEVPFVGGLRIVG